MKTLTLMAFALLLASPSILNVRAHADDSPVVKAQNAADDANTQVKKKTRDAQEQARKDTGTDNVAKDAQDQANNAGDDISNTSKKVQRKIGG